MAVAATTGERDRETEETSERLKVGWKAVRREHAPEWMDLHLLPVTPALRLKLQNAGFRSTVQLEGMGKEHIMTGTAGVLLCGCSGSVALRCVGASWRMSWCASGGA